MCKILIFGGTTEGRLLAEFCSRQKISVWVSVVSDYGRELLEESPWLHVKNGVMERDEMRAFLRENQIRLVIDATHPFARNVSENIRFACGREHVLLVRCLRGREANEASAAAENPGAAGIASAAGIPNAAGIPDTAGKPKASDVICVSDIREAVSFLEEREGRILVTTGSHELASFRELRGFAERVYARVLPSSKVIKQCEDLGISGKHLIAMQGPFSAAMNRALLEQTGASWMVTKESGSAGGFNEKLEAASACGVTSVIIRRPEEEGKSLEEVMELLRNWPQATEPENLEPGGPGPEAPKSEEPQGSKTDGAHQTVILAGIGMGDISHMTEAVLEAVRRSDAVLGAGRMLTSVEAVCHSGTAREEVYLPDDVIQQLQTHPEWHFVTVLYSGDTGFYSGAAGMASRLRTEGIEFQILPGISSVSYFAAKLGISWGDARIWTAHGRTLRAAEVMDGGAEKNFVLMGGENGAGRFCGELVKAGYGKVRVTVGEKLSYPEERIRAGTAAELAGESFSSLCLLLIERK